MEPLPFKGSPAALERLSAALGELDGAPVRTSIFFSTDGAGTLASGPQSGAVRLYDLTSEAPASPRELPLHYRAETRELVGVMPADLVLEEGHRYAGVVDETWLEPSSAMAQALAGQGPYAAVYAPLRARAQALGLDLSHVGAATVFTVGTPSARLVALRQQLGATPLPKARVTRVIKGAELDDFFGTPSTARSGLGDPKGVVHEAIAAVVLGTFEAPWYLSRSTTQLGRIVYDATGAAKQNGTTVIPFLLTIPRRPPGSTEKVPLLIYQHGLNSGRVQAAVVANDYARAGYATIGADALWHSDRASGATDLLHNLSGAEGPDGLADLDPLGALTVFFTIKGDEAAGIGAFDGRYVQDNFRQAVVELGQLVRLAKLGDLSAVAAADASLKGLELDGRRVVYTSESFGSILGSMLTAVDPDLEAAVLSVGGAGLFLPIFSNSPFFSSLLELLLRGTFDARIELGRPDLVPAAAQRSLNLLQAALEPGDPVVYVRRIARAPVGAPKSVLLFQAYSDEILPNQAGELLASAVGAPVVEVLGRTMPLRYVTLPTVKPPLKANLNGATVGVLNVAPATHTMYVGFKGEHAFAYGFPPIRALSAPVPVDNPTEWVHDVALRFADSFRRDGLPTISIP
ncbi:MAG: hypothetical protein IT371_09525 [Deltaproteobacteria bacterium]|nr:hypothetical protein [Deltaproteobacteria bacterium]